MSIAESSIAGDNRVIYESMGLFVESWSLIVSHGLFSIQINNFFLLGVCMLGGNV